MLIHINFLKLSDFKIVTIDIILSKHTRHYSKSIFHCPVRSILCFIFLCLPTQITSSSDNNISALFFTYMAPSFMCERLTQPLHWQPSSISCPVALSATVHPHAFCAASLDMYCIPDGSGIYIVGQVLLNLGEYFPLLI